MGCASSTKGSLFDHSFEDSASEAGAHFSHRYPTDFASEFSLGASASAASATVVTSKDTTFSIGTSATSSAYAQFSHRNPTDFTSEFSFGASASAASATVVTSKDTTFSIGTSATSSYARFDSSNGSALGASRTASGFSFGMPAAQSFDPKLARQPKIHIKLYLEQIKHLHGNNHFRVIKHLHVNNHFQVIRQLKRSNQNGALDSESNPDAFDFIPSSPFNSPLDREPSEGSPSLHLYKCKVTINITPTSTAPESPVSREDQVIPRTPQSGPQSDPKPPNSGSPLRSKLVNVREKENNGFIKEVYSTDQKWTLAIANFDGGPVEDVHAYKILAPIGSFLNPYYEEENLLPIKVFHLKKLRIILMEFLQLQKKIILIFYVYLINLIKIYVII